MKLFFSQIYASSGHEFDTTRKSAHIAESLSKRPLTGIEMRPPAPVSYEELTEIHEKEYVTSVMTGVPRSRAQSQGFPWDENIWNAVCASTGGVVAASMAALDDGVAGTLSSGLHHARFARGDGFCTFNGLALAAIIAHRKIGGRVLVLDLDAHCGGGTHELLGDMPWARSVDVSVCPFDVYRPSGGNTLDLVHDEQQYLKVIAKRLDEVGNDFALCIYNAGMDPYELCDIGGLRGITKEMLRDRERLVFDWGKKAGVPVAFTVAGGYAGRRLNADGVVELHRMTLEAATTH